MFIFYRINYLAGAVLSLHMGFTEIIGIIAGICTSSSMIPQISTTIKRKKANDVSVFMFVVLGIGNGLWIYYGAEKSDVPIVATNILALSLTIVMMILKYKYRKAKS